MGWVKLKPAGSVGLNKDLSDHELPEEAWTDATNVRFLDGYAHQSYGHGEVYNYPSGIAYIPQHVMPCTVSGERYWVYAGASSIGCVTITAGEAVHTDLTPTSARTGTPNAWTSCLLSGIPILNAGDGTAPIAWNLDTGANFVDLSNWPGNTSCKALRSFKNFLIAMNVTKGASEYPYMLKWSHPSDPGALPESWDEGDATKLAGELDVIDGTTASEIVDGLQLRDTFMVYTKASIWRLDFVGGNYVFKLTKALGKSGALNRNCIAELPTGYHLVLTTNDIIIHDGQQFTSILDKITRRWLFQNIDPAAIDKCFVFINPFFNEAYICWPSNGSVACDKAIVFNYTDNTVGIRDLPDIYTAAYGPVDDSLSETWAQDVEDWDQDIEGWDIPDYVPAWARVIMGTYTSKLMMLDASSSFAGVIPAALLQRNGLSLGIPDKIKLVRSVRPRIKGSIGGKVNVTVGGQDDPWGSVTWGDTIEHTIGSTVSIDTLVSGRYIAVKFESNDAQVWRLDSYDLDVQESGEW